MPNSKRADEYRPDDWFVDPHREGRRPAVVIDAKPLSGGLTHMVLDDNKRGGQWCATYPSDQQLECA
jgi:hypothetical protein